ncbi:inositol phosphatase Siw14p [[Candida] railenensis]|uniref:diphosphoinositol-polyphosphate diphosphatase n=1 Tax=[Candida] railenensis TaxID=45579 RepID=A0A9P0VYW1_9ASCO|nr:inositol phosphatase Siw14p [[Candida] railenensis]
MNEYSEDPFQMDEDLKNDSGGDPSTKNSALLEDITPRYEDPTYHSQSIMYQDREEIRSKIAHIKLEERNAANNNTTEEDEEEVYDEDIDDKFDTEQYNEQLQAQNGNIPHSQGNRIEVKAGAEASPILDEGAELTPPENFAPVINTIYRSSFPQPVNFTFLKKLKLKSILCLIPEDYPLLHQKFLEEQGIKLFQLGMSGNKEPFVKISSELITDAIKIVIDPENQPILIHCNRGKHRTGCLVGVLRRLQKWSLTIIFDEYRKFAAPKERPMDQQFIELYDEREIVKFAKENEFLPLKWD